MTWGWQARCVEPYLTWNPRVFFENVNANADAAVLLGYEPLKDGIAKKMASHVQTTLLQKETSHFQKKKRRKERMFCRERFDTIARGNSSPSL